MKNFGIDTDRLDFDYRMNQFFGSHNAGHSIQETFTGLNEHDMDVSAERLFEKRFFDIIQDDEIIIRD